MDVSSKIEGKIGSRIGSGGQGTWQMARGHMLNKCYYLLYMKEIINYIWVEQLTVCTPFGSFTFASDDTWVVIRWWWYWGDDTQEMIYTDHDTRRGAGSPKKEPRNRKIFIFLKCRFYCHYVLVCPVMSQGGVGGMRSCWLEPGSYSWKVSIFTKRTSTPNKKQEV